MLWEGDQRVQIQALPYISLRQSLAGEAAKGIHGLWDIDAMVDMGICGPNVLMVHCVHRRIGYREGQKNMTLESLPQCMFQHVPVIRRGTLFKAFKGRRHLFLWAWTGCFYYANDMIELMKSGPAAEVRYQGSAVHVGWGRWWRWPL